MQQVEIGMDPHNKVLKSLVATLLLRTWQPVTDIAIAISAPERPRRLTRCYASLGEAGMS